MNRYHTFALLVCAALAFLAGCEQTSIARQEEIRNFETVQALTPSPTSSPTITPTLPPTATATATEGPSPTPVPPTATTVPSATPVPSPTPLPPTPTANAALKDFSLCTQPVGDAEGGRFSARVTTITTTVDPNFERVVFALDVPADSAKPHATARCLASAQGGGYELRLSLDGWLHDEAFSSSVVSATQALSGTKLLQQVQYVVDPNAQIGADIVLPLAEPNPFYVTLQENPYQLVVEVATSSQIGPASDMLTLASPGTARPATPIYYIQDGDIWRSDSGPPEHLTKSEQAETAISVSRAGGRVAYCQASSPPGDPLEVSSLWVMELDGQKPQELTAPGRTCAEPAFSPDGKSIAFVVDEDTSGVQPARLSIWTIDLTSGRGPQRVVAAADSWSRYGPQWLADGALVYAATNEDGRSTLFLRSAAGEETDIGAPLLSAKGADGQSLARFESFGRPLVAPDGKTIAVEALRVEEPGADLVLLDGSGAEIKGQAGDGFWSRPVAFDASGTLYYLTSACASDVAQSYTLIARPRSGADRTLAVGQTLGGFGSFVAYDGGLAYVAVTAQGAGSPRGPQATGAGPSALWIWDLAGGARSKLVEAPELIPALSN
jgi:hypothetical protein